MYYSKAPDRTKETKKTDWVFCRVVSGVHEHHLREIDVVLVWVRSYLQIDRVPYFTFPSDHGTAGRRARGCTTGVCSCDMMGHMTLFFCSSHLKASVYGGTEYMQCH
jgi:hypothetical protein